MATYKLDENPNTYISAQYVNDKFEYIIRQFDDKTHSSNVIRDIDLREHNLSVYETVITESMFQMLHDSLLLKHENSHKRYWVNCNGALYIWMPDNKKWHRTSDGIFDWSRYGVVVPNSVNDVLRKRLQEKDMELEAMRSLLNSVKGEASANKASFEASKQEAEELKELLSTSQKDQDDMNMELQKVRSELSIKEFELETKKIEFELSKEEVKQLQDELSASKKNNQNMENEMQMIHDQLSSTCSELKSTKILMEDSMEQLAQSRKECEDMQTKIQIMHHQLHSAEVESQSIKTELDSSIQHIKELESQISSYVKENQEIATELQNVRNELSHDILELQLTKTQLESSNRRILELVDQLKCYEKERELKDAELLKVQDQLSLFMNDQLQSMKIMFEFTGSEMQDKSVGECFITNVVEIIDE